MSNMKEKEVEISGFYYKDNNDYKSGVHYKFTLPQDALQLLVEASSPEGKFSIIREHLEKTKRSLQGDYDNMEDDLARFKGISVGYKAKFETEYAKQQETLEQLYNDIHKKAYKAKENAECSIKKSSEVLKPLVKEVQQLREEIGKLDVYAIDKLTDSIKTLSNLYGENKEMFAFLVNNYKKA